MQLKSVKGFPVKLDKKLFFSKFPFFDKTEKENQIIAKQSNTVEELPCMELTGIR